MSITNLTKPGELGELASEAIRELITRATGGQPVSTYAEGESPIKWSAIEEGGWDFIGVEDEEPVSLRDLAEVAMTWGTACVQLPLLPSILVKRHSEAAREIEGPLTLSIHDGTGNGNGVIPYGQLEGIQVARSLGGAEDTEFVAPTGEPEDFDILLRGTRADWSTTLTPEIAREAAVLFAAESAGAAAQLLDDGVAYAKEREQFGKAIGSFQAVKHHLANALIDVELAQTGVIWASLHPDDAFRGAKWVIDSALSAAETVLQVHGGMGFTWELGLHFYVRRIISARDLVVGLEANYG